MSTVYSPKDSSSSSSNHHANTSDCRHSSRPIADSTSDIAAMTRMNEKSPCGITPATTNSGASIPVGHPLPSLDPSGPLPNEIFELLNEFWRPSDCLPTIEQQMTNEKATRRNSSGHSDDTIEEEKDCEEDTNMMAEVEQEPSPDRNSTKRRYSRLSDGYERLKSVLPSVKDKRRVSKARILDEAISYIQRLESITNVLKREHEKRMQLMNGGTNGYLADYGVQPFVRSLFPKQMYHQQLTNKMPNYPKVPLGSHGNDKAMTSRMKAAYQYANSVPPSLGTGPLPTDYSGYSPMGMTFASGSGAPGVNGNSQPSSNNNIYPSDPNQVMNGDASPINNTSPYSACSVSPGTPNSYQNGGSVNNAWPYHQQGSISNSYTEPPAPQPIISNRQGTTGGYGNTGNSYTNLTSHGMWNTMQMADGQSMVPPSDHPLKVV